MSDIITPDTPDSIEPADPSGGAGSVSVQSTGATLPFDILNPENPTIIDPTDPSVVGPVVVVTPTFTSPTVLLKAVAGRDADNSAFFVVGESDILYAYLQTQSGAYTITSASFQLTQGGLPVFPPNGSVDFRSLVPVTYFMNTEGPTVEVDYLFYTAGMDEGSYDAFFTINATGSDGVARIFMVPLLVILGC